MECKSDKIYALDEDRNMLFRRLIGLEATHPAIIYAQKWAKEVIEKAKEAALKDKETLTGTARAFWTPGKFQTKMLLEVFKFLAEATPEMWEKALAEQPQETVAESPVQVPEALTPQVTPEENTPPQKSEFPVSEKTTSPSHLPWFISLAVVFLAGLGYIFHRRKES